MTIPAFDEKELKVVGESFNLYGSVPLFDTPVSLCDGYLSAVRDRKPIWQITGIETQMFTPSIIPDNVARALVIEGEPFDALANGGGKDMFGIDWEYVPQVGGSMVRPGNPFMEDMYDWKEKVVWPDIDSWDWEGCAEKNKDFLNTTKAVRVWFQTGWYERLISFMEFENAIMALFDEDQQDLILEFFDKLADLYIRLIDKYVHYFPQVKSFFMHDDWGSQKETFFSPALVEKMIVPSMKKVTDHIHSIGCVAELHSCGQIMKQVPNMIKAGWDTWSGQVMNDTHALYEQYGDKIMIGVIPEQFDPAATTEEEQRALAREFAAKFCNPEKPCVVNLYGTSCFTPAYREELYKEARIRYSKQ